MPTEGVEVRSGTMMTRKIGEQETPAGQARRSLRLTLPPKGMKGEAPEGAELDKAVCR